MTMNRRERLLATLRGEAVDRPAVSFHELEGTQSPSPDDPYNVYSDPSWQPLLALARDRTDLMPSIHVRRRAGSADPNPLAELTTVTHHEEAGARLTVRTIRASGRVLTERSQRDRDVDTVWTTEHLCKDIDDLQAWLALPEAPVGEPDVAPVLAAEAALGDAGIVRLETGDPICEVASMMDMATFTVVALTEPALMHALLERAARRLGAWVEKVSAALPGRLWRIYGPEYASPPYVPPRLFEEYVVRYDRPLVESIQRRGGWARIHSHGRLRDILDAIASMGAAGLDPIEPPPLGDMSLAEVRARVGGQMVLFGNIEMRDVALLPADAFRCRVMESLDEGTRGPGRGFVLMPSAAPIGREIDAQTLRNYEIMVECVERMR